MRDHLMRAQRGIALAAETVQEFTRDLVTLFQDVILSEAKDLLSQRAKKKQVLRFAQDDSSIRVYSPAGQRAARA